MYILIFTFLGCPPPIRWMLGETRALPRLNVRAMAQRVGLAIVSKLHATNDLWMNFDSKPSSTKVAIFFQYY